MTDIKCAMCEQFLFKDPNKGRLVCINTKCPDYFEPAVAHPRRCGYCLGTMAQEAVTEELGPTKMRWRCLDPLCPESRPPSDALRPKLSDKDQLMANLLEKNFKTDGPDGVTLNSIPHPEPKREHGVKLDMGKPLVYTEFLRQFPRAIRLVARVGEKGTQAPGHVRSGWKSVEQGYERYSDAFARHILKEAILATSEVETEDPMQDLLWEAATVAWNDLARLEHLIRQNSYAAERLDGDPLA